MEEDEHILDSFSGTFPWADEGHPAAGSFLASLELSAGGPILPPARRSARGELILGTAGAILVHALAAAAFFLLPLRGAPLPDQGPFIQVFLADMKGTGCTSSGTGSAGGVEGGKAPERPPLEVKTGEKEQVPGVVKPKTVKHGVLPAKKRKSRSTHAKTRHTPTQSLLPAPPRSFKRKPRKRRHAPKPENLLAGSREEATVIKDGVSEDTGVDPGGGAEKGVPKGKEAGEGGSAPGGGGFSSGRGLAGEFDATSVDKAPQILKKVEPAYPAAARRLGICGRVVVKFLVEPDGSVAKLSIVEAHPRGFFERPTLEAVGKWRFKPGRYRGNAVATWVILPVEFRLTGQD